MNLDHLIDRIVSTWPISFKAWLPLAIIGSLGTYTRNRALYDQPQSELIKLVLLLVLFNLIIFLAISQATLRYRKTKKMKISIVIFSVFIIWITSCSAEILLTIFLFDNPAYLGPQLFAPLLPDFFGIAAVTYLLSEFQSNKYDRSRLAFAQDALLETSEQSRKQIMIERSQLITAIQNSVFYHLDALKKQFNTLRKRPNTEGIQRLADELEKYSANTIRSLSHEMAADAGSGLKVDRLAFIGSKRVAPFTYVYSAIVSFKLSLASLLLVGGFHELSLNGFPGLGFQVLVSLILVPILGIGALLTRRFATENITLGFISFLITIFLCGYVTVLLANYLLDQVFTLNNVYESDAVAGRSLTAIVISSLLVTIVEARRRTLNDLIAMNQQLQTELDWIDGRSQEIRRELSTILHGPLQGRIAGIAMALRMSGTAGENKVDLSDQKLTEIEDLLASVVKDVQELFKFEQTEQEASIVIKLIALRRSWAGIAELDWTIEPEVFAGVKTKWLGQLSDILYESVSNSVRHGKATKVKFYFKVERKVLRISVLDNGIGIKPDFIPSVGLHKITEFGAKYAFSSTIEQGAELLIDIALD